MWLVARAAVAGSRAGLTAAAWDTYRKGWWCAARAGMAVPPECACSNVAGAARRLASDPGAAKCCTAKFQIYIEPINGSSQLFSTR